MEMQTANRDRMRQWNTNLVLNAIRGRECLSQVDLVHLTGLSSGTVTNIVRDLKDNSFVEPIGVGKSAGAGRRPALLRFNAEAGYVISAAFFADETFAAVLDLCGQIKKRTRFATGAEAGPREVFRSFASRVTDLLQETGVPRSRVWGIAAGFEGIVDPSQGTLVLSSRFGWRNVAVKAGIEEALGIPTFIESDGGAMALGEYHYGAGRGAKDLVCLDIDSGIGSVAIYNGEIRRGAHSMAGEIGHALVMKDGPTCACGRRGCLEAVASGSAILAQARRGLEEGRTTTLSPDVHSSSTREALRAVFQAAEAGDAFASELVRDAGRYLGLAAAWLINYADPECLVLTGCVTQEGRGQITRIIREVVRQHVIDSEYRTLRIVEGSLGEDAPLIGAATRVYDHVFRPPLR
jgi:predicted NBD/HSP70 family sugar kinase